MPCSTAGDEGRRLIVAKDTEGKPMTTESRQAEVRRLLMLVKPITRTAGQFRSGSCVRIQNGRWQNDTNRKHTPNGWNPTVDFETPNDAHRNLQEVMDHDHWQQTETNEHINGLPQVIQQMLTGQQKTHPSGWQGTDLNDQARNHWSR